MTNITQEFIVSTLKRETITKKLRWWKKGEKDKVIELNGEKYIREIYCSTAINYGVKIEFYSTEEGTLTNTDIRFTRVKKTEMPWLSIKKTAMIHFGNEEELREVIRECSNPANRKDPGRAEDTKGLITKLLF